MRREYDFSKAKRGPVMAPVKGKTRITIRVDDDLLAWFKQQVNDADPTGRILITVYSYSGANRRIISSRKASPGERKRYEAR